MMIQWPLIYRVNKWWSKMIHHDPSLKLKPLRPLSVGPPHFRSRCRMRKSCKAWKRCKPSKDPPFVWPWNGVYRCLRSFTQIAMIFQENNPLVLKLIWSSSFTQTTPLPPQKKTQRVWNTPFCLWIWPLGDIFGYHPPPPRPLLVADTCPQVTLATTLNLRFSPPKLPKRKFPQLKGEESPNTIRAKIPDVSSNFVGFFLGEFLASNKIHTAPQPFPSLKTLAHSI